MADPNLIACLYSANRDLRADDAIRLHNNSAQYIPPLGNSLPARGSRESTVSEEDDEDEERNKAGGLQLTFNPGPRTGQGFMFGTDANRCDIVLPKLPNNKIGRLHCVLTFDAERRLILRDLSKNGTIVTYDGQGREKRHHFTWILSSSEAMEVKKIVIQIGGIKFQIIVSQHKTYPDLYNNNVDRFLHTAITNNELHLGALGIQSSSTPSTAQHSGVHTPTSHTPVYINQCRLGSGAFSVVYRVWDVSTGVVYASKEFVNMEERLWRREAHIMHQVLQLSNEHIVQFVRLIETPSPQLILEYLPFGNLQDQHTQEQITYQESLTILCQSLNALSSVHEANIVHRDIKPENILVQSRQPLHIKLSDFGLSKATADLETFCGTPLYLAPEICATGRSKYYTKACDIWSLGVVVFEFAYGPLPNMKKRDTGVLWCKRIIMRVDNCDSEPLLDFLATAMLLIEPEKRFPTRICWEQALQLCPPSQSRCLTPTQVSYSASDFLNEGYDPTWATPGAATTEVATFRYHEPHGTNAASAQATGNHYLIPDDTEEQELEGQRSLDKEGTAISKARKTKRKTNLAPSPRERPSITPTHSSRHSSTTSQRPKRTRRKEPELDLPHPEGVDENSSKQESPLEEIEELSVPRGYQQSDQPSNDREQLPNDQPSYQPNYQWAQLGSFSGEPTNQPGYGWAQPESFYREPTDQPGYGWAQPPNDQHSYE